MSLISNLRFKRPGAEDIAWVTDRLTEFYENQARKGHITKKNFSASSLAYGNGQCPRYWYLAFDGAEWEDNNDAQQNAVMFYGTAEHNRIQEIFSTFPEFVGQEVEFTSEDPPFRGFIDLVFERDGEKIIGEYKTTRQEAFVHRQAKMQPTDGHLLQVLLYMHFTEAKYAFILYENKNTQELVCIPVKMTDLNQSRVSAAVEWMETVYAAWQKQQLPERPYKQNSKVCKECPVRSTCWGGEEGVVKIARFPIIAQS